MSFDTVPAHVRTAALKPQAVPPPPARTPIDERLDALGLPLKETKVRGRNATDYSALRR